MRKPAAMPIVSARLTNDQGWDRICSAGARLIKVDLVCDFCMACSTCECAYAGARLLGLFLCVAGCLDDPLLVSGSGAFSSRTWATLLCAVVVRHGNSILARNHACDLP